MRHHSYASLFEFTLLAAALSGCGSDNKPGTGGGGEDGSSRVIISSADGITLMQEHLATLTGQTALSGVAASSSLIIAVGGTRAVTSP